MQIAGFPHWENVYSNILAFFLDTSESHGFGSLFIRSLMAAYRGKCGHDGGLKDFPCPEAVEATAAVKREVKTSDDKRIDLVVDCGKFLVCIENKIWASLYNDLKQYRKHCEKDSDGHPVYGIVLSPKKTTRQKELDQLEKYCFLSITYEDLVREVRLRLGSHIGPHNTRYQYLLFDFLEQASRFSRTAIMDKDEQAFLDFWKKNDPKISNMESWIKKMWDRLDAKGKAATHREQCLAGLTEPERRVFKDWTYQKRVAVFDLAEGRKIGGDPIFLDVEFHPLRVTHVLGSRRGSAPIELASKLNAGFQKSPDHSDRLKIAAEKSPLDHGVCEEAIETSICILKYIASRASR